MLHLQLQVTKFYFFKFFYKNREITLVTNGLSLNVVLPHMCFLKDRKLDLGYPAFCGCKLI